MVWLIVVVLLVGAGVWVRLAPSDPARWHVDPQTDAVEDVVADGAIRSGLRDARVALLLLPGTPAEVLAKLDAVALATPRTLRLAGDPAEGRMTWITRSRVAGFPDYTTASATAVEGGTRLDLYARTRFGGADLGVSAARLRDWVGRLRG